MQQRRRSNAAPYLLYQPRGSQERFLVSRLRKIQISEKRDCHFFCNIYSDSFLLAVRPPLLTAVHVFGVHDTHGHPRHGQDSITNRNLKGRRLNNSNYKLEGGIIEPARMDAPKRDELLAEELRALVSSEGPLGLPAVPNRYQAVYGKSLTLHGYSLRARLMNGNLPGLLLNGKGKKTP